MPVYYIVQYLHTNVCTVHVVVHVSLYVLYVQYGHAKLSLQIFIVVHILS